MQERENNSLPDGRWGGGIGWRTVGVFVLFFALYISAHELLHPQLMSTDDPYYHAKHSLLMLEHGLTYVGAWSPYHFLTFAPTDAWWLYHVVTAGCIALLGFLPGVKVVASLSAAAVFASFYYVSRRLNIERAGTWTFLLFGSSALFMGRLLFERPFVISIALMVLGYYYAYRKRLLLLVGTAFIYTLTYNLSPLVVFNITILLIGEYIVERRADFRPLLAAIAGIALGMAFHPYAANYVYVMYIHFFKIFALKLSGVNLSVGAEIQSLPLSATFELTGLIILFQATALAFWIKYWQERRRSSLTLSLALISTLWFAATWFIPRAVEYWAPFCLLFIASMVGEAKAAGDLCRCREQLERVTFLPLVKFFAAALVATVLLYNGLITAFALVQPAVDDRPIREVATWLADYTPAGSVVTYPVWSLFPRLFFYNDHNRYVTAFDPTFLYDYDQRLYYVWANLANHGAYCPHTWPCLELTPREQLTGIAGALHYELGSEIVVIPKDWNRALETSLQVIPGLAEHVYENEGFIIFKIAKP